LHSLKDATVDTKNKIKLKNKMSKKLVSAALTATTLLWMVGAAVLPVANAQSTASIQAEIANLLSQINQLQGQLGTTPATTASASMSYTYNHDLTVGSTGADVNALQQYLITNGYLTAVSAPTGYFGTLTQAAVAKWQAANGISPTAGYFGPKSRAFMNAMVVMTPPVTTPPVTTTPTSTPGTPVTTTSVVAPASGLAVQVASDNPVSGAIISSSNGGGRAARVPVLGVDFTAGDSGAVTISSINFNKVGVLSDSSVSGAYLIQNGQVIAQYNSLNQGVLSFSGLQLSIPAGQTLDLQLAIDPASGLNAGNTVSFSLDAASDITAFDVNNNALTAMGPFPMNGNSFTVTTVTNPELATMTITSSSIANSVTAGTQGNIVGAWNFNVGNNLVWLKGITFHVIGSANKGDIRNVKLMVNGTQVGPTLATVPANGLAYFDASATPGTLNTGSNNVQVYADVMGSPSYNFQFEVLNSYDVLAVDSQYGVPIGVTNTGGAGTSVGILTGTITTSQDSTTPTGNVAVGQSGVTLAKFDIYAGGEAVKVEWLDFSLAFTGAPNGSTLNSQIRNVALTDDAGGQVGTTINTPPSGNSCADSSQNSNVGTTAGTGTFSATTATYEDCFGSPSSNINYIVPANTTRVLSLKGDVQSTATFSTVTASLLSDSQNLQGMTSDQLGSSSGAVGSALSLASTLLTISQNNALATPVSVTKNSSHVKIGSYNFQASSASGVQVNTLTITMGGTSGSTSTFQNLGVFVNGTQFGQTQGVVSPAGVYSFSGAPFTIPSGQSQNVDVYADVLSGGASTPVATTLSGCSATGVTSYNAITCTSVGGQNVTIAGAASISVTADGTQPSAGQIVMGSTGNSLAIYRFTETSNAENVKVTQLTVRDGVSPNAKASFSDMDLKNGSTILGNAGSASQAPTSTTFAVGGTTAGSFSFVINGATYATSTAAVTSSTIASALAGYYNGLVSGVTASASGSNLTLVSTGPVVTVGAIPAGDTLTPSVTGLNTIGGYYYTFQIQGSPIIVPQANSISITLTGDTAAYSPGATDDTSNVFLIATSSDMTALGNSSNAAATASVTGANGNTQTVLRTVLTPSVNNSVADGSYYTPNNHQARTATDDLAELKFSTNIAGGASLTKLVVTFSGSAASSTSFLGGVQLLDSNGISIATEGASVATSSACNGTTVTTCYVTWTIPTSTVQAQISAGSTGLFKLRINDNLMPSGANGTSLSLSAQVVNTTDVNYYDSLDNSGSSITSIPVNEVPIPVASFSFPQGV
jgi:hypothetical protein